ncbi:MAG: TolC family protein, partial [Anaeromyxobacteraceae bacterium]
MSAHRHWACALVLAYGAPALAQEARPVRWADVVVALDRDPRVAASRSRLRAAEGGLSAVRTPPNPELEATIGRGVAQEGPARRAEWGLALTVPLEWLARRGPEIDAARATVEEAAAEAQALRAEVSAELWRLHVRAGYAHSEVEALEATERQVEALTHLVRRRVEAGEGRPVEIPRVELELERVRNEVAAARAGRDGALAQLGAWLAVSIQRVELPAPLPPVETVAAARELTKHPRLRAALARAEAAKAEASAARRSRVPGITVGAFYASELDREAVGGRVAVELPLWDWKSGRVQRAEASAAAEASRADAEGRALAAGIAEAAASCSRART